MNLKIILHELIKKYKFILGGFSIFIVSLYLLEIISASTGILLITTTFGRLEMEY